MIQGSN